MLDVRNPTEDDVKWLTAVIAAGEGNKADYHVDRLDVPQLRFLFKSALRALVEAKTNGES